MIEKVEEITADVISRLVQASHGAIDERALLQQVHGGNASIFRKPGAYTFGILFDRENHIASTFGFHGTGPFSDATVRELDELVVKVARENNCSKVQVVTPRYAWKRLLQSHGWEPILIALEKEL